MLIICNNSNRVKLKTMAAYVNDINCIDDISYISRNISRKTSRPSNRSNNIKSVKRINRNVSSRKTNPNHKYYLSDTLNTLNNPIRVSEDDFLIYSNKINKLENILPKIEEINQAIRYQRNKLKLEKKKLDQLCEKGHVLAQDFLIRQAVTKELMEKIVSEKLYQQKLMNQKSRKKCKIKKVCTICMDSPKEFSLTPCGHYGFCLQCAERFDECPYCKADIEEITKIYEM